MDERDQKLLPEGIGAVMKGSIPHEWLPFLPDHLICDWRDFIAQQIDEDDSQTLVIFGGRINTAPEKVRELLDDDDYMQSELWDNVTRETLAEIEDGLYQFAREQMLVYLDEFF